MRGLLPVLLLTSALLLPMAEAEGSWRFDVEPLEAPVEPLQAPAITSFVVEIPCAAVAGHERGGDVRVWPGETPGWMRMVVSPMSAGVHEQDCVDGALRSEGQVVVTVDGTAPAFDPTTITLHAALVTDDDNVTLQAPLVVEAGFFSILDTQLVSTILVVEPGGTATFPLVVLNLGNSDVRVLVEVVDATEGIFAAPVDFVLARGAQEEVPLRVTGRGGSGLVNQVSTLTVVVQAEHPERGLEGDRATLSVMVTEKGLATPGPSAGLLVAAVVGLALARRVSQAAS